MKYATTAVYIDPYDDAAHELLAEIDEKTANKSGLEREQRVLAILSEWRKIQEQKDAQ